MRNLYLNPLLIADQYKLSHRKMLPDGCNLIYSNMTPRKSRVNGVDSVVVFGLQYFIKEYLIDRFNNDFFNLPRQEVIDSFTRICTNSLGPNIINSDHVGQLHDLGYLPLKVKALEEGTECPIRVPFCTIYNTHPNFAWLTNFIETISQSIMWRTITSATDMHRFRKLADQYASMTSDSEDFVDFQFHTFSMRGNAGLESACLCDAGHLLSFKGSDTIPTIPWMEYYYNANSDEELISCSVSANEHSIVSSYGNSDEFDLFKHLMTNIYPEGILSMVSDTWDLTEVINPDGGYLARLKDEILNRNGKIVIRPDSSRKTPLEIICGDDDPHPDYNDRQRPIIKKGLLKCLDEIFGHTVNSKGYKELHPNIGLIYGECISYDLVKKIFATMRNMGYASTNFVAGIGSFEHEYGKTRDTYGIACKATYTEVDNKGINIFKDPITDDGMKTSLTGLLKVNPDFTVTEKCTWDEEEKGLLKTVFEDGELVKEFTLEEVRNNLKNVNVTCLPCLPC